MLGIHQAFDGIQGLIFDALSLGADTFQFFVRNNRNLKMRQFHVMDFKYFNEALENSGITTYVLHASYAMNPASIDEEKRQNAVRVIKEDLSVLASMNGNKKYVLHPGSATDCYRTEALMQLVKTMYDVFPFVPKNTTICLEFMAGQGTQLLSSLMEIKALRTMFEPVEPLQICVDTCHMFGAGFPPEKTIAELENVTGFSIGVIHLNNSAKPFGSNVDRHAGIYDSTGKINVRELEHIYDMYKSDKNIPIILETPEDYLESDFKILREKFG